MFVFFICLKCMIVARIPRREDRFLHSWASCATIYFRAMGACKNDFQSNIDHPSSNRVWSYCTKTAIPYVINRPCNCDINLTQFEGQESLVAKFMVLPDRSDNTILGQTVEVMVVWGLCMLCSRQIFSVEGSFALFVFFFVLNVFFQIWYEEPILNLKLATVVSKIHTKKLKSFFKFFWFSNLV